MAEYFKFNPLPSGDAPSNNDILTLKNAFQAQFGQNDNTFIVKAPGRVNIIGEHIDYCGYGVFPMAIEKTILICAAPSSDKSINLVSTEQELYSKFSTSIESFKINQTSPSWFDYFLCGIQGILDKSGIKPTEISGINALVMGSIPPAAGLSSSSALVCAATAAAMACYDLKYTKEELAELCCVSERYIGTQGGGMDQAIACLAEKGTAKYIEFNPLKTKNVKLPNEAAFVIANSCVEINKANTSHFNTRVVECRLGTQVLAKLSNVQIEKLAQVFDVQKALGISLTELNDTVKKLLHEEPYSREEICTILNITDDYLEKTYLSVNTKHLKTFKLFQRLFHVSSEARRVLDFKSVCESGDENAIIKLGTLMTESHKSCRDMYECSHMQLDQLIDICLKGGALGSRLTGAGWGGCTVSLVHKDDIDKFVKFVKEEFYFKVEARKNKVDLAIFPTSPGGGVEIYF